MLMCFRRGLIPCLLVLLLQGWAAADIVLDDSDWRSPGLVSSVDGIEHEMLPSLLLKTQFEEPVFLFDPTDDETITCITDFQGKLYLGSCTQPAATDTGSVFTYDPETNAWEKVFQVNEQGLVRLEVYGDRLYIPGYDANDGGWDLGNIYVHEGETWVEHRTVPRAVHIYGLAVYKDRIYVSADILDEPPPGMTVEEASQEGLSDVYGRVLSSADGGQTWREEYRGHQPGQDIGFMTVFRDSVIVNANCDLLTFDGEHWKRLGLNPNALIVFDYADAGDTLILGTSLGLGFFDGRCFRRCDNIVWVSQIRAVRRYGSSWLLVGCDVTGGTIHHGPRLMSYPSLTGKGRAPLISSVRIVPDDLMRRAARADLPRKTWWEGVQEIRSLEMLTTVHVTRGRVYFGTHPEGRVLVLPVVKEGVLDSAPRPIRERGTYRISWESATPPGTSCRLQVRSASTREALDRAPFVGPDGETSSFFEEPGTEFEVAEPGLLQYRAILETDDPALTPYLKRVTVRAAR